MRLLTGRLSALGLIVFWMMLDGDALGDCAAQLHAQFLRVVGVNLGLITCAGGGDIREVC